MSLALNDLEKEFYERALAGTLPTTGASSFTVSSEDTISISNSAATPNIITGLISEGDLNGFSLSPSLGAVRNASGRTIGRLTGTFSFQPLVTGGSTATIVAYSERSSDGVVWTPNADSLRAGINVTQAGQSFRTLSSFALNLLDGEYLRFGFYYTGIPTVEFSAPSDTIGGNLITGHSFLWSLRED